MTIRTQILAVLVAAPMSIQIALASPPAEAESAAAPAAPVASAPAAKSTAVVIKAATLRDRPKTSGTGSIVVPLDTRVRIESVISNGDGNWAYVTSEGIGGGWVLESVISSPKN